MELWQLLGNLHPKLVQFPLVLLLVGLLFDGVGLLGRSKSAHWAGMACSGLGTLGLLFAFICGIYAEIWAGRAGIAQHPIELHELMANIASWGFVILLAWRIFLTPDKRSQFGTYLAAGFSWYLLLAITGYLGGQLVFEYGAAVSGVQPAAVLGLSDLNTLATRQTDENLRYSEWMHHIFGWMTLGLAASLLIQAVAPKQAPKFRWIVPAFLLIGGFFLFFMADRDLYALTDLRQFRDREVQLHKSLAIIMAVIGGVGMWRILRKPKAADATSAPPQQTGSNSKLVAVLALIGGSMLFTHVHTVAPYANVAAGVYIAHVVMGLVALTIGITRLMQDFFPAYKRQLALVFAGAMAIESVLLINYNEGLPWFIGYGKYNRWGPLGEEDPGVSVAPFGSFRALMDVNNTDGQVYVAFRDRFDDKGVELTFDRPPQLLIARGYEEIAIPLIKAIPPKDMIPDPPKTGELTGTNFVGSAEFLKSSPWLSARLVLPMNGKQHVGYFDPWVTRAIKPIPPNEVARFECPMHAGMRSPNEGKCTFCKMDLQPIRVARSGDLLHDAGFEMRVSPRTGGSAGMTGEFLLMPTQEGKPIPELAIVHEQPMHLIVVSADLNYFDHVHPVRDEKDASSYVWRYQFPQPGQYLLFADFTPKGDRAQYFRTRFTVTADSVSISPENGPIENNLAPDQAGTKLAAVVNAGKMAQDSAPLDLANAMKEGMRHVQAQLLSQPRTLAAGIHTDLLFRLSDAAGRPVSDLVPYLGAMGHCVIISEDTSLYLHSHPQQIFFSPDGKGGPDVPFSTVFPKAGRYRIFAQFKRPAAVPSAVAAAVGPSLSTVPPEQLAIAEFTVVVRDPVVPASWINFFLGE